jgi:hypothetical protein
MDGIGRIASAVLKGEAPFSIDTASSGQLGSHSVSTNSTASDIARAAALNYHEVDVEPDLKAFLRKWTHRKKSFKSKFAKNTDESSDPDDPDIDEAVREEKADNHPAHRQNLNIHIARRAQTYTRLPDHLRDI